MSKLTGGYIYESAHMGWCVVFTDDTGHCWDGLGEYVHDCEDRAACVALAEDTAAREGVALTLTVHTYRPEETMTFGVREARHDTRRRTVGVRTHSRRPPMARQYTHMKMSLDVHFPVHGDGPDMGDAGEMAGYFAARIGRYHVESALEEALRFGQEKRVDSVKDKPMITVVLHVDHDATDQDIYEDETDG